jgi:SAM-dependent methyltransferase
MTTDPSVPGPVRGLSLGAGSVVPDAHFAVPRLAGIYDDVEGDRSDLDAYVAIVQEFGSETVLDVGCGTGTLAVRLALAGVQVIGLDPAAASIAVAQKKPGAERVRWMVGDVRSLPPAEVDLVTMTGNVAQVFLSDGDWDDALRSSYSALVPGGRLVFEVRDPAKEAWREWTRERSYRVLDLPKAWPVETWVELTAVELPMVSFDTHFVFGSDSRTLTSSSTLRFRNRDEVVRALESAGFVIDGVRDAPDRPGRELVFITLRS